MFVFQHARAFFHVLWTRQSDSKVVSSFFVFSQQNREMNPLTLRIFFTWAFKHLVFFRGIPKTHIDCQANIDSWQGLERFFQQNI